MPKMLCERHGPNSGVLVCGHISAAVLSQTPIRPINPLEYGHVDDPALGVILFCHLCEYCRGSLALPPSGDLIDEELFCRLADVMKPVCGECLDSILR
jgi:hypothetical protein